MLSIFSHVRGFPLCEHAMMQWFINSNTNFIIRSASYCVVSD